MSQITLISLIYSKLQIILGRICLQVFFFLSVWVSEKYVSSPSHGKWHHKIQISQIQKFVVMFFWPEETLLPGKCSHRMLCLSFINILVDWKQNVFPPRFCSFPFGKPSDLPHEPMCVSFAYFLVHQWPCWCHLDCVQSLGINNMLENSLFWGNRIIHAPYYSTLQISQTDFLFKKIMSRQALSLTFLGSNENNHNNDMKRFL